MSSDDIYEKIIEKERLKANHKLQFITKEMKNTRNEKKLTVMNISSKSGISYGYVSDIENGKHLQVGLHTIIRYCQAMNEDYLSLLIRAEEKYQAFYANDSSSI